MNRLLLSIFISYLVAGVSTAGDTDALLLKYEKQIGSKFGSTLKLLADSWSIDVLEEAISPEYFEDYRESYEKMLINASSLGKFQGCGSLDTGMLDDFKELENSVTISGECNYENGSATIISHIYVVKDEAKILVLVIQKSKT